MALITRVSRLFRADINAILDCIEEPDIVLRQALRDMTQELQSDQRKVRELQSVQTDIVERTARLEKSVEQIDEELTVCFNADNETLARTLIRRKLESNRMIEAISRQSDVNARRLTQLQARVSLNSSRLQTMQQQAQVLDEEKAAANSSFGEDFASRGTVRDEDIEVAFLREKQNRQAS